MEVKIAISMICAMLLLLPDKSNGIKCYNCGSLLSSDSACEDPFESGSVASSECSGSCTKMKADRDGSQFVARGCSFVPREEKCDEGEENGVNGFFCACNTDLCNTASSSGVSVIMILVISAASFWEFS